MVATVGLAVLVLMLVTVGLLAARGQDERADVVEVPSRRDSVPTTSGPSGSSSVPTTPSTTPSTTIPSTGGTTTVPKVDTSTPRIMVNDQDGRFAITVPRTWLNVPSTLADQNQWQLLEQLADGKLNPTPFVFAVRWAPSESCNLEQCTQQVLARIAAVYPGVVTTTAADTIGTQRAARIEAAAADQRVVAWVVVEGDRYWVAQLRGPSDGFDAMLAAVRPVVATMSFG